MKNLSEVLAHFTPVKITDEIKKQRLLHLENCYKDMATDILEYCSNDEHRYSALKLLLESKYAATHSVTHGTDEKAGS